MEPVELTILVIEIDVNDKPFLSMLEFSELSLLKVMKIKFDIKIEFLKT